MKRCALSIPVLRRNSAASNVGNGVIGKYGQEVAPGDGPEAVRRKVVKEVPGHSCRWEWHADGSISVAHIAPCRCFSFLSCLDCDEHKSYVLVRKHIPSGKVTFSNLTNA